jgi:acyl-CoA reductase-like NAD-dependent aldehyde dehydrogenase
MILRNHRREGYRNEGKNPMGAKQSGIGTEMGEEGLAEFSPLKIINAAI